MTKSESRKPGLTAFALAKVARTLGGKTGFERFQSDVRDEAYQRLGWVGLALAVAALLSLVAGFFLAEGRAPLGNLHPAARIVLLAAGLVMFLLCRSGRLPAGRFAAIALTFEVVVGAGLATQVLGWQQLLGPAGWPLGGAPGVGIWVLFFAGLVPLPARKHLLGAALSALFVPVFFFLSLSLGQTESAPPTGLVFVQIHFGVVVSVALAAFTASLVYRLSRDLSEARRMGSYQLTELLGKGGMGEVWKAEHQLLARPAAIKLIRPEIAGEDADGGASAIQRFEREVQATAGLRSPHTIYIYDYGVSGDGTFYYVMEILDGIDLDELVKRDGPQPIGRVIHILRQICHSLGEAHAAGLTHRDIKPANIFLCRYGRDLDHVKVLDFGLVKERSSSVELTQAGSFVGTPAFLAPEMVADEADAVGPAADVYAVGCVAFWLLTGRYVFPADSVMAMILAHVRDAPTAPSEIAPVAVPPYLDELILCCLEKEPGKRPASMDEVEADLARLAAEHPWPATAAAEWWQSRLPKD